VTGKKDCHEKDEIEQEPTELIRNKAVFRGERKKKGEKDQEA